MATFKELGISKDFIKGLNEYNILEPTEIQEKAIPYLLEKGKDFIGQAQTGTGKTAAFGLPLLSHINPKNKKVQALILSPTRELGKQIAKHLFKYTKYTEQIFTEAVYGGEKIELQIAKLRRPTQIIVATPGRLIDLLDRKAVDLSNVKTIVLDEADEMLSMGFKKELTTILNYVSDYKTWLFSATMPDGIKQIIKKYLSEDAFFVKVSKRSVVNKNIYHKYMMCDAPERFNFLFKFLKEQGDNRGVVFCKTKKDAQVLAKKLSAKNVATDAIHGDLIQKDRDKVMRAFKNKKLQVLVATDLAARGIDVENLAYVVHYQIPDQLDYYTHRSGRTARAGKKGISLCFVSSSELKQIKYFENKLNIAFELVR